jgi:hypothetical protein
MNPRIPDDAFQAVANRSDGLQAVTLGTAASAHEAGNAAHNYARSLGLDGEGDDRAVRLAASALTYLEQYTNHTVTTTEVHAAVAGIQLGLALAHETGWDPPRSEGH